MPEMVDAHVTLEAVSGAGQRQAEHAGVVHKNIHGFERVSEAAHRPQVSEIKVTYFDVTFHFGRGALGLVDSSASDEDVVAGGGERRCGRFADTAVPTCDDDSHRTFTADRLCLAKGHAGSKSGLAEC